MGIQLSRRHLIMPQKVLLWKKSERVNSRICHQNKSSSVVQQQIYSRTVYTKWKCSRQQWSQHHGWVIERSQGVLELYEAPPHPTATITLLTLALDLVVSPENHAGCFKTVFAVLRDKNAFLKWEAGILRLHRIILHALLWPPGLFQPRGSAGTDGRQIAKNWRRAWLREHRSREETYLVQKEALSVHLSKLYFRRIAKRTKRASVFVSERSMT